MSTRRSKSWLRPDVRREPKPQVVGLAPLTSRNDRRANIMTKYLLRRSNTVEAQAARRCVAELESGEVQSVPGEVVSKRIPKIFNVANASF